MNIVIVGCGSIGLRHLENLLALGQKDISVIEADTSRAAFVKEKYGVSVFASADEWVSASGACDAALICSPSSMHAEQALWFAGRGAHLFIEKPVGIHPEEVSELRRIVKEKGLVTMVGYNMHFYPLFIRLKELLENGTIGTLYSVRGQFGSYLPDWRPNADYRKTYSAHADQGGGILLDSHEFEYMTWLAGEAKRVFCLAKHTSNLEIDTEDVAAVTFEFANGAIGSLSLDYLQRFYQRDFEFVGSLGTLHWQDSDTYHGKLILRVKGQPDVEEMEPVGYDRSQTYRDEMSHFLECIEQGKQTVSPIDAGIKCLEAITAAKESSVSGRMVEVGTTSV